MTDIEKLQAKKGLNESVFIEGLIKKAR